MSATILRFKGVDSLSSATPTRHPNISAGFLRKLNRLAGLDPGYVNVLERIVDLQLRKLVDGRSPRGDAA